MRPLPTTGAIRTATLGLAATLLLTGCGGDETDSSAGEGNAPSTSQPADSDVEESSRPEPGEFGSNECPLTQRQLDLVVRDWTRLYDTVGRQDHGRYTQGLLARLERVEAAAEECDGSEAFETFRDTVATIDERSTAAPDYDVYTKAVNIGNAWLDEAGLGPNALLRG